MLYWRSFWKCAMHTLFTLISIRVLVRCLHLLEGCLLKKYVVICSIELTLEKVLSYWFKICKWQSSRILILKWFIFTLPFSFLCYDYYYFVFHFCKNEELQKKYSDLMLRSHILLTTVKFHHWIHYPTSFSHKLISEKSIFKHSQNCLKKSLQFKKFYAFSVRFLNLDVSYVAFVKFSKFWKQSVKYTLKKVSQ